MPSGDLLVNEPLAAWLPGLLAALGLFLAFMLLRALLLRRLEGKTTPNIFARLVKATNWLTGLALALGLGSRFILLPPEFLPYLRLLVIILLGLQITRWVSAIIDAYFEKLDASETGAEHRIPQRAIASLVKIVVWAIVVLLILENIPYLHISSLITGLGIGGIAVSLAAQKVIADLLSSITIRLDKPFAVGDSISAGGFTGKVELIGLRSTRLRNISGEELTFSNSDLLASPIQNFTRMDERRVQNSLPVSYRNSPAKLEVLPALVRKIVEETPNTRFGSFYLTGLSDLRMRYTLTYYISSREFEAFQQAQNTILLALLGGLKAEGIVLAGGDAEDDFSPTEE